MLNDKTLYVNSHLLSEEASSNDEIHYRCLTLSSGLYSPFDEGNVPRPMILLGVLLAEYLWLVPRCISTGLDVQEIQMNYHMIFRAWDGENKCSNMLVRRLGKGPTYANSAYFRCL